MSVRSDARCPIAYNPLAPRKDHHMAVRGYILVETEVGRTQAVGRAMRDLESELATVSAVDTVTGPYDVIVQLDAEDLDQLGQCITAELQAIDGVQRTTTCLAVSLG